MKKKKTHEIAKESIRKAVGKKKSLRRTELEKLMNKAGVDIDSEENVDEILSVLEEEKIELEEGKRSTPALSVPSYFKKSASDLNPVSLYLRDIGRISLLTKEKEKKITRTLWLAKNVLQKECLALDLDWEVLPFEDEDALSEILKQKKILSAERKKKVKKWKAAYRRFNASRQQMIEANLRLVVSMAKRYCIPEIPFLDLINEGNIGLMRAVERFDYRKGFKFATYASWWIRQSINRALDEGRRSIRLPVHITEIINQWIKAGRMLAQRLKREATPEEIGKELGLSKKKISAILRAAQEISSLDTSVGDGESTVLGDLIKNDAAESPLQQVLKGCTLDNLRILLERLSWKERFILERRYGLGNLRRLTLQEVGMELKLTRERVRQIEKNAIEKMRALAKHIKFSN